MATGIYPNPVHSTNVLGKIDHQFSGADQFSVRYALYDVTSDNAHSIGTLNAPSGSTELDNRDQSIAISDVWTISSNTVSETRLQIAHGDLQAYRRIRSARRSRSPVWRRSAPFRAARRAARTRCTRRSVTCHTAPEHMRCVPASIFFQQRHDHVPAHVPRQLHLFVARKLPDVNYNGFAQTFGDPS